MSEGRAEEKVEGGSITHNSNPPAVIALDRIRSLSDSVIAIVLTLIIAVLEVPSPNPDDPKNNHELTLELLGMWKTLLGYFAIVGLMAVFWLGHVFLFAVIRGADSTVAMLNILFLMAMSFEPFCINVLINWFREFYTALLMNGVFIAMNIPLLFLWLYVSHKRRFLPGEDQLSGEVITLTTIRLVFPLIIYAVSIGVARFNIWVSFGLTMSVPLFAFLGIIAKVDASRLLLQMFRRVRALIGTICCCSFRSDSRVRSSSLRLLPPRSTGYRTIGDGEQFSTPPFIESKEYHKIVIDRIKSFSDAIFAIVITILVLQLHAPTLNERLSKLPDWQKNRILGLKLIHLWPVYVSFFISVLLTATYWKSHTKIIRRVVRIDYLFLVLNIAFLALVSLIPLASLLLGRYPRLVATAVFYNFLLLVIGTTVLLVFFLANFNDRLMIPGDAQFRRKVLAFIRITFSIVIYAIATGVAFSNAPISISVALVMPIIEFLASFEFDIYVFIWKILFRIVDWCRESTSAGNNNNSNAIEEEIRKEEAEQHQRQEEEAMVSPYLAAVSYPDSAA